MAVVGLPGVSPPGRSPACPLCGGSALVPLAGPDQRLYRRCRACRLVSVAPACLPPAAAERRRYLEHRNSPADHGYRAFLGQVLEPALAHLPAGVHGLDYGCGPTPVLPGLLAGHGFDCAVYDPFFFPRLPPGPFAFIFAVECFEHFHRPAREMARLRRLLAPGGLLAVMTEFWPAPADFSRWHYARDHTHVCFYHPETMAVVARLTGCRPVFSDRRRVTLLRRRRYRRRRLPGRSGGG